MPNPRAHFHIDLDDLSQMVRKSVRRAAAFLAIGVNASNEWKTPHLNLVNSLSWEFFPKDLIPEQLQSFIGEFQNWIMGSALRELDAGFNTFLDRSWELLALSKLHGLSVQSDYKIKTIDGDTNAAAKYEKILRDIGCDPVNAVHLKSFSSLRNCLTHAHGIVTKRHANVSDALMLRWRGLEVRIQQGDHYTIIPASIPDGGIAAPDPTRSAEIIGVVIEREKRFAIGEPVSLQPQDIHEICWNYLGRADEVVSALQNDMQLRGMEVIQQKSPLSGHEKC